eukprot:snap_masked-scaffold_1-processed-gene-6.10-mRNA-1 protein AED:1.00 eAED:1.00 QI:0/0/0/0/1/1/2/0/117
MNFLRFFRDGADLFIKTESTTKKPKEVHFNFPETVVKNHTFKYLQLDMGLSYLSKIDMNKLCEKLVGFGSFERINFKGSVNVSQALQIIRNMSKNLKKQGKISFQIIYISYENQKYF